MDTETQPLVGAQGNSRNNEHTKPLSPFFATFCIVDLFGVFPIIALPRAIIICGWLGIPLALAVFGLQIYTSVLLGRCWLIAEKLQPSIVSKSRYPYAALADLTFGAGIRRFVTFMLDITIFGAAVPNLLVASQNLQIVGLKMTEYNFNLSYCYWMIILSILLCPIMWLGSPKDMKWLTFLSVVIVLSVAFLTWVCMMLDETVSVPTDLPHPTWQNVAIAYGILAFQFDIHPMILTVQADMEDKRKLGHAIAGGFIVTTSLFMITTLFAMFRYGPAVRHNVLQGLPASDPLYIDVVLVTAQICLSMVVGSTALFQDLEDKLNVPREFNWRRCVLRSLLLMVTVLLGELVPRFDLVMGLIGGALTGPLMFVMPPLLYSRLRDMNAQVDSISFEPLLPEKEKDDLLRFKNVLPPTQVTALKEALATQKLFSDNAYRNIEDDTRIQGPPPDCWKKCVKEVDNFLSLDGSATDGPMTRLELLATATIVILGVTATFTATFFSIWETVLYARFTPPCIS